MDNQAEFNKKFQREFDLKFIPLCKLNPGANLEILEEHFKYMYQAGCILGMSELEDLSKRIKELKEDITNGTKTKTEESSENSA